MANSLKATAIAAGVLLAAFVSGLPILFHLAYAILGIIVLCGVWTWVNIRWIEVGRRTRNRRAQVGGTVQEHFAVRNSSFLPKPWVEIQDRSTLPDHRVSQAISIGPKRAKRWIVTTLCVRRGRYILGPVSIATGDAFGLFRRTRQIGQARALIVYPATVYLPRIEIPVGELPGGHALHQRTNQATPMASGVREYAPGDNLNRIHWPSTARMGRLMTKEFELDPASDIWILLDMQKAVQVGSGDESTEEYGVTIAASIARHFLDQNRSVGLIAYGARPQVIHSDRGTRQLLKVLEGLAVIRAEGQMALGEVIAAEGRRFGGNTTVIAISPATDESWPRALRTLTQRNTRKAGVVLEGSTFGRAPNPMLVIGELAVAGIPTYLVKRGDTLASVFGGNGAK